MADKIVEQPEVAVEETEKDLKEKKVEEVVEADAEKTEETVEAEDEVKENGDAEKEQNGKESSNGDSTPVADAEDKCCIKRKSTGGDKEEAPATEEVIPEKKAKLDDTAAQEAESNGEAEVAA